MPIGLRDLAAYGVGYSAQAYSYALLLTDRYPNSDPEALGPSVEPAAAPGAPRAQDDDGRRSRLTVFFRLLLALPHFVWLLLWSVAAFLAAIANWLVALVRGRSAEPLHRFLAAYIRYTAHVTRVPSSWSPTRSRASPARPAIRSTSRSARPSGRAAGSRSSASSSPSRRS